MGTSSMFNPNQGTGGGGSGSVTVIDNLNSNSSGSALSANQGRILKTMITDHSDLIAGVGSTGQLGHVRVDGSTIIIDANTGIISSVGGSGGDAVAHAQAILPTTIVDQETWKIPFVDYKYPDDLLIVTHNSTVVDTSRYSITQNIDGVSWDVNIPKNPLYPRPIADNNVFVIMIKGIGTGGGATVTVEDILTSTSTINALSANMGRALKILLEDHEKVKATKTTLGHVKIDDSTIKINQDGEIYVDHEGGITKLESYQRVLPTTVVGQNKWQIPLKEFDPVNDTILVSHNTTLLTNEMYEIYTDGEFKGVRILTATPSEIVNNNMFIIILRNVIADGTSIISGSIIINGTVAENKLSQELQDKINSSGSPQWETF